MLPELSISKKLSSLFFIALIISSITVKAQFGVPKLEKDNVLQNSRLGFKVTPLFNRVEGLFPEGHLSMTLPGLRAKIFAAAGYGLKNKGARYKIGIQKQFCKANGFTIGASLFDKTQTNDRWMVSELENSLAGIFLREDFYDYFETAGWKFLIDKTLWQDHLVRLEVADYKYRDMATFSNFSGTLFGGGKVFRPNPHVAEGDEQNIKMSFIFDWRDSELFTTSGWYIEGIYEKTYGDFSDAGEINTQGVFLSAKRYQPTWGYQRMILRTLFGAREGSTLPQHLMWIGGVGSLRGYRDRFASGQNFILLNVNYLFGGDILRRLPLGFMPFYDTLTLGAFADIGNAWMNTEVKTSLFEEMTSFHPHKDVGVSVLVSEGLLHIDFARQFGESENSWRITFRMIETF